MKVYDNSVQLKKIFMSLDHNYKKEDLSNEEIINKRWKNTEKALRKARPLIHSLFQELGDDVITLLKQIDFEYQKLNDTVSPRVKKLVERKSKIWKEKKILTGYLEFIYLSHNWTYKSVLQLLLCGLYAEKYNEIKAIAYDVFVISAVDTYEQAIADRDINKFPLLTMNTILSFALMPIISNSFVEYLDGLLISQEKEMENFVLVNEMFDLDVSDDIENLIEKQVNRIIKINKDKFSGGLDDATRAVANKSYTYTKDNVKVRFVAELDEKTTPMCRSLNNQVFFVNKTNTFKRYSASAKGNITVKCNGLVAGVNMPPISDHFHWCRSTLTYQVE